MFTNKYPYTDFHELNADWLIGTVRKLENIIDDHLREYIRETLDQLYADCMYEAETETLIMILGINEEDNDG